jgi:hypothetical protein
MQQITASHLEIRMRSLLVMAVRALLGGHSAVMEAQAKILSLVGHREQPLSSQMAAVEAMQTVEAVVDPITKQLPLVLQHLVQR